MKEQEQTKKFNLIDKLKIYWIAIIFSLFHQEAHRISLIDRYRILKVKEKINHKEVK